jgi:hypothetical protein
MLPCTNFVRNLSYQELHHNGSFLEYTRFELKNIQKILQQYATETHEFVMDSYEELIRWGREYSLERMLQYSLYPSIAVDNILMEIPLRDRSVAQDLELLRRVHRWYLKGKEIEE